MTTTAYAAKRDRLARLLRLVAILQAHPDGIRTPDIAKRVGMSVRTAYRDLRAIEGELDVPLWSEDGRWGVDQERAFLPPLKLTQSEAMAVVLSARLMVRYADKYDPDLAGAFEKLAQVLPPALAEHVEGTIDVLSKAPRDERFNAHVRQLTKAWADRRVVTIDYEPARYAPERGRAARDRPALPDRAVAADPRALPDRLGRDAGRAADLQDRADPGRGCHTAPIRTAGAGYHRVGTPAGLGHHR